MSKRNFVRGILLVVLVVILSIGIMVFMLDSVAKSGIEKGATYALDVNTSLEHIHIGLISGQVDISDLQIDNPTGFPSRYLMKVNKLDVEIEPSSLFSDVVHIRKFVLDGLDINVDQKLTANNVSKILDNIKRLNSGEQDKQKQREEQTSEGKKIFVNTITVNNVVAHFHLDAKLASKDVTVRIPTIILNNVSSEDSPVVIRELVMKLVPAILVEVIKHSHGIVPADIINNLNGQLVNMQNTVLKTIVSSSVKQAEDVIKHQAGDVIKHQAQDVFHKFIGDNKHKGKQHKGKDNDNQAELFDAKHIKSYAKNKKSDVKSEKSGVKNNKSGAKHKGDTNNKKDKPAKNMEKDLKKQGNAFLKSVLNGNKQNQSGRKNNGKE